MTDEQIAPSSASLALALQAICSFDDEYWSFADRGERDFLHGLFRYPAMMVPRLQRELLQACLEWDPRITSVYDPFVGSGTVMTEAMLAGRSFVGVDLNPLAILACRAKSELLSAKALSADFDGLMRSVERDTSDEISVAFSSLAKWFQPTVAISLSRLHRAILKRNPAAVRRFWWTVMAEVVRLTSNSRTSTVKLHIRPKAEVDSRPDPLDKFKEIGQSAVDSMREFELEMHKRGFLSGVEYMSDVKLHVADAREYRVEQPSQLLMTSPPYGDNHTTVTYGQASYLALKWIPRSAIGRSVSGVATRNTHSLDSASLGGSRRRSESWDRVLDKSPTLKTRYSELHKEPQDRRARVLSFFADMDVALDRIVENVAPGAPMLWTVGDRSVGGVRIPLGTVIREVLAERVEFVTQLRREIPAGRKRMPTRNAVTGTMSSETIEVLRRSVSGPHGD